MIKERHGLRYTPEYQAWADMKDRCTNTNNKYYSSHGARGITVCEGWRNSFTVFHKVFIKINVAINGKLESVLAANGRL